MSNTIWRKKKDKILKKYSGKKIYLYLIINISSYIILNIILNIFLSEAPIFQLSENSDKYWYKIGVIAKHASYKY